MLLFVKFCKMEDLHFYRDHPLGTTYLETPDSEGNTPLLQACVKGNLSIINNLVELGANIHAENHQGTFPLFRAAGYGHSEVVKALIRLGASPNTVKKDGETPLYCACKFGFVDTAKVLLEEGADLHYLRNNVGWSALMVASAAGHVDVVKMLLDKGADPLRKDENNMCAFLQACYEGNIEVAELLLERGGHVNPQSSEDDPPLVVSCISSENASAKLVELLLKRGADVNTPDTMGTTALDFACINGHVDIVALLISGGANVNGINEAAVFPLNTVCSYDTPNHTKVAKLLLHAGAQIDKQDKEGFIPVMHACKSGNTDLVSFLVSQHADISIRNFKGGSCLYEACGDNKRASTVQLLIEHGAEINSANEEGDTPLALICIVGELEIARMLLARGADVNHQDKAGECPISWVCTMKNFNLLDVLVQCGANVNLCDKYGHTPLHWACVKEETQTALQLLKHGAYFCEMASFKATLEELLVNEEFHGVVVDKMGLGSEDGGKALENEDLCKFLLMRDARGVPVVQRLITMVPRLQNESKNEVLQMFLRRDPVEAIRLHLCGPGGAGKTTLRLMILQETARLSSQSLLPYSATRTRGVEIDRDVLLTNGRIPGLRKRVVAQIFDHGGQQEFHVTYSNLLSHPMSVFLLVLPVLFEPAMDCKGRGFHVRSSPDSVAQQLKHWLCMLASLVHRESCQVIVVLNVFGNNCPAEFIEEHAVRCRNLIEKCEENSPHLRHKFADDIVVLSCHVQNQWKVKLFPTILTSCQSLQGSKQTIPSICRTACRLIDAFASKTTEKIVAVSLIHACLRQDRILAKLSPALLDSILLFIEQTGRVLLMDDSGTSDGGGAVGGGGAGDGGVQQVSRPSVVVLDPNWFCSRVIGNLFNYEQSEVENPMIKTAASLQEWFRDQLARGVVAESVIAMLPQLLCRMRLCLPLPSGQEFWMTTFMEHRQYDHRQAGQGGGTSANSASGDLPVCELQVQELWKYFQVQIQPKHLHTCQCSGRLVSLKNILGDSYDSADYWQTFIPGSFARFQIKVNEVFWRTKRNLDVQCSIEPLFVHVTLDSNTHVFAQMLRDNLGMQTCCRMWCFSSSRAAVQKLLEAINGDNGQKQKQLAKYAHRASEIGIAMAVDRKQAEKDQQLCMDQLLGAFVSWFLESCQVNGSAPHLHSYCIHPSAAGCTHSSTLLTGAARRLYYFPLETTRQALAAATTSPSAASSSTITVSEVEENTTASVAKITPPSTVSPVALAAPPFPLDASPSAVVSASTLAVRLLGENCTQDEQSSSTRSDFPTTTSHLEVPEYLDKMMRSILQNSATSLAVNMALLGNEVSIPRVFVLVRAPNTLGRFVRKLCRPTRLMMNKYYLFFICPVTLRVCSTNNGKGYSLEMPPQWVVQYGPAIRNALLCCRIVAGVAASQFNIPNPLKPFEKELRNALEVDTLTAFIDELDAVMSAGSLEDLAVQSAQLTAVTGKAYRSLEALLRKLDPLLLHCGCERTTSNALGEHTASEWVSEEGKEEFQQNGKKALFWNKTEYL